MRMYREESLAEARAEFVGEGLYAIRWSNGGEWANNGPQWFESAEDLAAELEAAFCYATRSHLPCIEHVPEHAALTLDYLQECTGADIKAEFGSNYACRVDAPAYYRADDYNEVIICQQEDQPAGLWFGEWETAEGAVYDDYEGRKTPEEVFEALLWQVENDMPKSN